MFTAEQFRTKAAEYTAKIDKTTVPSEIRHFRQLEQSFLALAQNEDWLANDLDKIIRSQDAEAAESAGEQSGRGTAGDIEEHILRCLGAAIMMHWNTLPTKLQRELFDTAGSMGELLRTAELRGQIARFLHHHRDDDEGSRRNTR
jgi:hypothetical protein